MNKKEIEQLVREGFDNTLDGDLKSGVEDQDIVDFIRSNEKPSDDQVHDFAQQMGMEPSEMEEKIYSLLSDLLNQKKEASPEVDVSDDGDKKTLKGGDRPDSDFDPEQLRKGIKVESEHTDDPELAKQIAKGHLLEDPEYYIKLAKLQLESNLLKEEKYIIKRDGAYYTGMGLNPWSHDAHEVRVYDSKSTATAMAIRTSGKVFKKSFFGGDKALEENSAQLAHIKQMEDYLEDIDLSKVGLPDEVYDKEYYKIFVKMLEKFNYLTPVFVQSVLIRKIKDSKQGETKQMKPNYNLREIISKTIKEYCDSKKMSLEEMFDFEKEQGDVSEIFGKKKKEIVKPKEDEKQNKTWQSFMEEEASPEQDQESNAKMATSLLLFIENDADLYRQRYLPMIKNLAIKKARGNYDSDKAIKLFMYLADSGAQKYVKYEDPGNRRWFDTFSKPIRFLTAKMLRDKFEQKVADKAYNYDSMLPKKYKGTELKEDELTLSEIWAGKSARVGKVLLERMGIKSKKVEKIEEEQLSDEQIERIYNGSFAIEDESARVEAGEQDQLAETTPKTIEKIKKDLPKTYVDKDGKRKESSPYAIVAAAKEKEKK